MLHNSSVWSGCFTALATPFQNGRIDYDSFSKLIEHQVESGVRGVVPCGTTGESPTLSENEHDEVVQFTIRQTNRRCLVLVGTGSNSTAIAVDRTRHARDAGADGALLVSPYYNKPSQEGLYKHYEAVARAASDLAIVLYDIPGRTGVNIEIETVVRLANIHNIVAIKEAAGKVERITKLRELTSLSLLSGDDSMTLPMMSLGASGVVSVASNIIPSEIVALVHAAAEGRYQDARTMHDRLSPLLRALFLETNPTPVKFALEHAGIFKSGEVRLPLVMPSERVRAEIQSALQPFGCASQA
ncbi:MAG: 4-hydroxy-tetrahydrodipicolinate synthase [Planctomycetes bacterium]|nr:4-hydroxy-tetrahydrodipicolinate synthase [Planctomycetota bacterium]